MTTSTSSKSVAILTGPSTHLDHLGVLSAVLEIPLIVTEEKTFQLAKRYYPQINISLMEMADLSMDFLCSHFDVIFESGKFWALELKPFMQLLFRKQMRFVFCPHGNSDKGHSLKEHPDQDVSLVYGDHLHDHLKATGATAKIHSVIATGNYRYPFYKRHLSFYDQIAEEEIFSRLKPDRKTLLYAPTWQDRENPTSFFEATEEIIEQLSPLLQSHHQAPPLPHRRPPRKSPQHPTSVCRKPSSPFPRRIPSHLSLAKTMRYLLGRLLIDRLRFSCL